MTLPTTRTRIVMRSFVCQADKPHKFQAFVNHRVDLGTDEPSATFKVSAPELDSQPWLPLPKCPHIDCPYLGIEKGSQSSTATAQVPESERFVAWLSPDGTKLAVPGKTDASMPDRYRTRGYIRVEARSIRDIDRFDTIRSAQTGNHAYNEVNYSEAHRQERAQAEYDPDDLTSEI